MTTQTHTHIQGQRRINRRQRQVSSPGCFRLFQAAISGPLSSSCVSSLHISIWLQPREDRGVFLTLFLNSIIFFFFFFTSAPGSPLSVKWDGGKRVLLAFNTEPQERSTWHLTSVDTDADSDELLFFFFFFTARICTIWTLTSITICSPLDFNLKMMYSAFFFFLFCYVWHFS